MKRRIIALLLALFVLTSCLLIACDKEKEPNDEPGTGETPGGETPGGTTPPEGSGGTTQPEGGTTPPEGSGGTTPDTPNTPGGETKDDGSIELPIMPAK